VDARLAERGREEEEAGRRLEVTSISVKESFAVGKRTHRAEK